MGFRENVGKTLRRLRTSNAEFESVAHKARAFDAAYQEAPWQFSRMHLLSEADGDTMDFVRQMRGWEQIGSLGGEEGVNFRDLERAVRKSRWAFKYVDLIKRMVTMWTDYAFGTQISIVIPDDPVAQEIFDAFWNARANKPILSPRKIDRQNNHLIVDGELFWAFFVSKVDGSVRIRRIDPLEITRLVHLDGDKDTTVLYQRESLGNDGVKRTRYYKDWMSTPAEVQAAYSGIEFSKTVTKADDANDLTDIYMAHLAVNTLDERGWPMPSTGIPWALALREFMEDRAALVKAVATFYEDITTSGGSRGVDAVVNALSSSLAYTSSAYGNETNPTPPAGTPFVHNEAVKRERMPLTTSAGDAQMDSLILTEMSGVGMGIQALWLNRPDAAQNRAVARELAGPTLRMWTRHQLLWSSVFSDMVKFVLRMAATYPVDNARVINDIENIDVDVSLDPPLDSLFTEVIGGVCQIYDKGLLPAKELSSIVARLPEFGLTDVAEIIDEMYPEAAPTEVERQVVTMLVELIQEGNTDHALAVLKEMQRE